MRKDQHTAILEFTVIKSAHKMVEKVGEKLHLSQFGEYCPERSLRGYSLIFLIENPDFYAVTKVRMMGRDHVVSLKDPKNYARKVALKNLR